MTVIVQPIKNTVEIIDAGTSVEVKQIKQVVDVTAPGPQGIPGPQGLPGEANLGGFPVVITNPQEGDLIQFSADETWVNSNFFDGGNF